MRARRLICGILALSLLLSSGLSAQPVDGAPRNPAPREQIYTLMQAMSSAEKVSQLFLISFDGSTAGENSEIASLLRDYPIGGVVLDVAHNNFAEEDTVRQAFDLISSLQQRLWDRAQTNIGDPETGFVPLFVGYSAYQKDGVSPTILHGLTGAVSAMSLGASWNPDLAAEFGLSLGADLSAMGVNLYLGPRLDVLNGSDPVSGTLFGTHSFGGDPYWVGEMGQALIRGLHEGSNGRLAVVAQHFPGLGSADRSPETEVSTVQKSLEQLKQVELAPYLAVGGGGEAQENADGLMVSHIRFQGLQGNIRATTRPLSFDQQALEQLLSISPLSEWHSNGGLMVSESLGSDALRLFFETQGSGFDALNVARTAFLAGNDLLFLDNFQQKGDESALHTVRKTLEFFTRKYTEDALFAQRVNLSVERILETKLKLYGSFKLQRVLPDATNLQKMGQDGELQRAVARDSATLIAPSAAYLSLSLPDAPALNEYISIFTDTRTQQQCSECSPENAFGVNDFAAALLALYGQGGGRQLNESRVFSYSFTQLNGYLSAYTETATPLLGDNLARSSWIIFNLQDENADQPASMALERLLAERAGILQNKKVIVFAFGAPYYLDSTQITKLSAYYALYNKNRATLESAARLLMQEMKPTGALPVSLRAIGYDLNTQIAPDPGQVLALRLLNGNEALPLPDPSATPVAESAEPLFRLGEAVRIETGPILDHNGNLVPDGSVVRFTVKLAGESLIIAQPEATTVNGLARIEYRIEREGVFEVSVVAEPATTSGILVLNTQGGQAQLLMPTPTPTVAPSPVPQTTPEIAPPPQEPEKGAKSGFPRLSEWLLMVLLLALGAVLAYWLGHAWWGGALWGLRGALCTVLGGLLAYLSLYLGIEGIAGYMRTNSSWFVSQIMTVGLLFGWIAGLLWWLMAVGLRRSRGKGL